VELKVSSLERPKVLPPDLARALADEAPLWLDPPEEYQPRLVLVTNGGHLEAAALVVGRPHTAAVKVAQVYVAEGAPDAEEALASAVVDLARAHGKLAVRVASTLGWDRFGFAPLDQPRVSGPGTEAGPASVLWLKPLPHDRRPYYRQTTEYTCGPCTLLMASATGPEDARLHHRFEYNLWRRANNFPACDPLGLAVAAKDYFTQVEVLLSTTSPVLVEGVDGDVRALKVEMQKEHRLEALELGIPIRPVVADLGLVAQKVAQGWKAFLLIDAHPMHAETWPHWILAHGYADGIFVVEDPWVYTARGETWIDGHDLPIAKEDLETMTWFGTEPYRGVILVKA